MTSRCLFVLLLLLALNSQVSAGDERADLKEIKALIIDVEKVRRMEADEQKKHVGRLYRVVGPRVQVLFRFSLVIRKVDYNEGRDELRPEEWVDKAWAKTPDAYMYLLFDTRKVVYTILKNRRAELEPLVRADLKSKDEMDVYRGLHVVSEVRDKEFFEAVLEVFEKNAECSARAVDTLRDLGDPRAIAPMVKHRPDLAVVYGALRSLQAKRSAHPALVALLDSKDAEVRARAAYALAESGDPVLVDHVKKLVRDGNPQVRSAAASMGLNLEKEAYARVRPAVIALIKDPDPGVKRFVVGVLARQRDPVTGPVLLEMARDSTLTQQEHYEVMRMIYDLTNSQFGYDVSPKAWRPSTPNNQEALRRFAEWVEEKTGKSK